MTNKTCGNCKHLNRELAFCRACGTKWLKETDGTNCQYFEKITPPTKGDVIRQGGNRALAEFQQQCSCDNCVYFDNGNPFRSGCGRPHDKTCIDGMLAWLNTPAESEKTNE